MVITAGMHHQGTTGKVDQFQPRRQHRYAGATIGRHIEARKVA